MKKFVIKNKPKRKYTKKVQAVSSFSFSKTIYGVLPLVALAISFMATLLLTVPLRDTIATLQFNVSLPHISFTNPLTGIQQTFLAIGAVGFAIWMVLVMIATTIISLLSVAFAAIIHLASLLNPIPVFATIGNGIQLLTLLLLHALQFIWQGITIITTSIFHGLLVTGSVIVMGISAIISFIQYVLASLLHGIVFITTVLWHFVVVSVDAITKAVTTAVIALAHGIWWIATLTWSLLVAIASAITAFFAAIFRAIVQIIEFPFKLMTALWLQIKPFVDVLLSHIQMTGADLSNGFASWGKVASLMGVTK
jgi:hypothetical protein